MHVFVKFCSNTSTHIQPRDSFAHPDSSRWGVRSPSPSVDEDALSVDLLRPIFVDDEEDIGVCRARKGKGAALCDPCTRKRCMLSQHTHTNFVWSAPPDPSGCGAWSPSPPDENATVEEDASSDDLDGDTSVSPDDQEESSSSVCL